MAELNELMASIKERAVSRREERQVAILSTDTGANRMLRQEDSKTLDKITEAISNITDKPVFKGYTFNSNVETLIGIASALQYMKRDDREELMDSYPELYEVFDDDTRSEIIDAYGRLPYLAEEVCIEVNGESICVDPDARTRGKTGIKPRVAELETLVNTVAIQLGLLGEYTCTQAEADKAWIGAERKVAKAEILEAYKDSL